MTLDIPFNEGHCERIREADTNHLIEDWWRQVERMREKPQRTMKSALQSFLDVTRMKSALARATHCTLNRWHEIMSAMEEEQFPDDGRKDFERHFPIILPSEER